MSDDRSRQFLDTSIPEHYDRYLVPYLFEPWTAVLLDFAEVGEGDRVLDIASGTGVVARAAARRVGAGGRVVASDISPVMLEENRRRLPGGDGRAPVEFVEASALELPLGDDGFDVALCQQGLPFIPDRVAALRELRRVLRPGGTAAVAIWVTGSPLEPFASFTSVLEERGEPEPFPGAFAGRGMTMTADEVAAAFDAAGFADVQSQTRELEVAWPDAATAAQGVLGTPFGPVVQRGGETLLRAIEQAFGPSPVRRMTVSVLARGTA
jgi:SAM-dependent methyltransferase